MAPMRTGELAAKAGVNIQTIRFYERQKLLRAPERTAGGYRVYARADLEDVSFIQWCKQLGFTLKEIRQLLQLHRALAHVPAKHISPGSRELHAILEMAQGKLAVINAKIRALQSMSREVVSAIQILQKQSGPVCPASLPHSARQRSQSIY